MTNSVGCPILNPIHSLTAGAHGPLLVQDVNLFDKCMHFDREQLPPRNVHAMGVGVYGSFTVSNDLSKYTAAKVFEVGEKTDIFVRFSGIFTDRREAETVRDPRGYAIKFYTKEGNWDLLAINTPVFPVRDMQVGPDLIHAYKRDPRTFEWNPSSMWDFIVNHPEALHQILMTFTDRGGTPSSYRNMNAYGCNTYSFINAKGERHWIKFHILSNLPPGGLAADQAKIIAGEDPDFLSRDLRTAIEKGNFPTWKMAVQIMPEAEGYKNPLAFDCTKVWPHSDYPLIDVGQIELNRLPVDYFSEVEQSAFSPSNIVPGIGFSPDRILQGRLFMYPDTQFHRLGPNYRQIPINQPHVQIATHYMGAPRQMDYGKNKFPHYYPSNYGGAQPQAQTVMEAPIKCEDASYYDFELEGTDADLDQSRAFISTLSEEDTNHLVLNIAQNLAKITDQTLVNCVFELVKRVDESFSGNICSEYTKLKDGSCLSMNQVFVKSIRENLQQMTST